ncbi:argininosuccinate lyase [Deferribacter desulfuricans SSM1]|uniref:Argininosuccinate lyase n=1 Tax=Deferribacter desulfuricans (strain DSM 14783 / JCM 11476 / NBRC 101012 / SSM1) TaxID=639282 RepID=D3PA18_DEFDS|nr:argininosuccinate lyase [Deferribacter desulfuricans]BAI81558.1 argininosuccinate lyase [Deferribacter desulfuricans SSM1]
MSKKLWGGRFELPTDKFVDEFNASIHFDKRLYKYDIKGSLAHVEMLSKQGIIHPDEAETIKEGLLQILEEIEEGKFEFKTEQEDIHMAIESRLKEIVGDVGGKLHTARSRNDQVAVDFKMFLKDMVNEVKMYLKDLMEVIVKKAEENLDVIMPGFTHLQTAQPILYSHYLMAYFQMFKRDYERFSDAYKRLDENPLGACALAGTTFPIDRFFTTELLGFSKPTENSLDSVSDRDFALEILSAASICQMHLSRLSEEIIIYATSEFDFIELSDDYCTGSSIMPQKKNPDVAELIRGKTGNIYGSMISLFTTMKALPLAYNKDMQEDKQPVFRALDDLMGSLKIMAPMLEKVKAKKENMLKSASKGYSTATELADYLVRKGIPFRDAHFIVGKTVKYAIEKNKQLDELSLDELKQFCDKIENDVYKYINVVNAAKNKNSYGGTGLESVKVQIENAKKYIKNL